MTHKRLRVAVIVLALVLAQLGQGPTARALTLTVDTTGDVNDGGCLLTPRCSLREAISDANANPGPDIIRFAIPPKADPGCNGAGVCTIQPGSALPALTDDGTTIDGYTQFGAAQATKTTPAVLKIEIDGSGAGGSADGFAINSADNVIRGLVINRFSRNGVEIFGSGTRGNTVSGNYIGTDASGTADLGNTQSGVYIGGGAQNNTIGGDTADGRNVISGNGWCGVYIGSGTMGNVVSGNYIGTDASGTTVLGNTDDGVTLEDGPQNNTVGGDTAGERNVISGNGSSGIRIESSDTNTVSGNYIGTDASGTADLCNTQSGVYIYGGANNTIGGDVAGERNVISGNGEHGVYIEGSDANTVSGNYIGTDASGTADLGNTYTGVYIDTGAQSNTVGGGTAGERNVISGNGEYGVYIAGSGTMSNTVSGNTIGTDASGAADLGNAYDGIAVHDAQRNVIGGDTEGERNVISGNGWDGISIYGSGATGNTVAGNTIGTDASGASGLGNTYHGVAIYEARHNTVGPGNVIAYNGYDGVEVNGSDAGSNIITQNSIFSNVMGIDLVSGANRSIDAPAILGSTFGSPASVVGTACAGCTVELFANGDADGEGETFVGGTVAGGGGAFTVAVPIASLLNQPHLTATATDVFSGTSEFSTVYTIEVEGAFLPLVLR